MAKRKMSENSLKNLEKGIAFDKNNAEFARKAQRASVKKRNENKRKRESYTRDDGFDELADIQLRAKQSGNIRVELEACIQKNKLNGHFIEKVAQTDAEGNDIMQPPIINILPVEVKNDNSADSQTLNVSIGTGQKV